MGCANLAHVGHGAHVHIAMLRDIERLNAIVEERQVGIRGGSRHPVRLLGTEISGSLKAKQPKSIRARIYWPCGH
jgi:hypothetical protein